MKEDYPHNIIDFSDRFTDDESCRIYLETIRWPHGFICPVCKTKDAWKTSRNTFYCSNCKRQTSVTAGTIFAATRIPLRVWFYAMWFLTGEKNGISAKGLQRELGISRYETVWTIIHKLRRSMVRPGRDLLSGNIEIDETYIGGPEGNLKGRKVESNSIVAIAVEVQGDSMGRIRLKRIPDVSSASLHGFVSETIERKSSILTDAWNGYNGLTKLDYNHNIVNIKRSGMLAHELLPHVSRVAALLKRWLLGTHQGAIEKKHLDFYLDEFVFRFNRRTSKHRGKLFYRLIQQTLQFDPITWEEVSAGTNGN